MNERMNGSSNVNIIESLHEAYSVLCLVFKFGSSPLRILADFPLKKNQRLIYVI